LVRLDVLVKGGDYRWAAFLRPLVEGSADG
jgi:hypothetical protein